MFRTLTPTGRGIYFTAWLLLGLGVFVPPFYNFIYATTGIFTPYVFFLGLPWLLWHVSYDEVVCRFTRGVGVFSSADYSRGKVLFFVFLGFVFVTNAYLPWWIYFHHYSSGMIPTINFIVLLSHGWFGVTVSFSLLVGFLTTLPDTRPNVRYFWCINTLTIPQWLYGMAMKTLFRTKWGFRTILLNLVLYLAVMFLIWCDIIPLG